MTSMLTFQKALGIARLVAAMLIILCSSVSFSKEPAVTSVIQTLRKRLSPRQVIPDGYVSPEDYVGSAVLGTVLGFGIGHATLGMWQRVGWAYTFGEILSLIGAGYWSMRAEETCNYGWFSTGTCNLPEHADEMATISIAAFGILRLVESIDLWVRPKVWRPSPAPKAKTATFSLAPLLSPHATGASLQLLF